MQHSPILRTHCFRGPVVVVCWMYNNCECLPVDGNNPFVERNQGLVDFATDVAARPLCFVRGLCRRGAQPHGARIRHRPVLKGVLQSVGSCGSSMVGRN